MGIWVIFVNWWVHTWSFIQLESETVRSEDDVGFSLYWKTLRQPVKNPIIRKENKNFNSRPIVRLKTDGLHASSLLHNNSSPLISAWSFKCEKVRNQNDFKQCSKIKLEAKIHWRWPDHYKSVHKNMLCFTIDCFWKKGRPAKSGCTLVRSKNMLLSFSQTVDRQVSS